MEKIMKRKVLVGFLSIILLAGLMACGTDVAWRKATVATYEIIGVGIGTTPDTADLLKVQGVISDAQLIKVKEVYRKARDTYVAAGAALKVAGRAVDVASRDSSLAEYAKLMDDFKNLSLQLYDLIKSFKKVSYNDVLNMVKNGGDTWILSL